MELFRGNFKKNNSTFEKLMTRLISEVVVELEDRFIYQLREENCSMAHLAKTLRRFFYFPSALYATDVKFHHTNRPQESQQESKLYFSRKHHLYGFKTEVSVSHNEFAIHASRHHPGFRAKITIFRAELEKHRKLTEKKDNEENVSDSLAAPSSIRFWGILFDKGYVGLHQDVRAFVPKKRLPRHPLTTSEKKTNAEINSDRIIVENWFGSVSRSLGANV